MTDQQVPVEQPPSYLVTVVGIILRVVLVAGGTTLVNSGFLTKDQDQAFIAWGLGGAAAIAAVIWSFLERHDKIQTIKDLLSIIQSIK